MPVYGLRALAVATLCPDQRLQLAARARRLPMDDAATLLLASGFCMAISHGTLYAFFTLHLQREGYSGSLIGFLWMLGVLGEGLQCLFLPSLVRRFALSTLLVPSAAGAAARVLALTRG